MQTPLVAPRLILTLLALLSVWIAAPADGVRAGVRLDRPATPNERAWSDQAPAPAPAARGRRLVTQPADRDAGPPKIALLPGDEPIRPVGSRTRAGFDREGPRAGSTPAHRARAPPAPAAHSPALV